MNNQMGLTVKQIADTIGAAVTGDDTIIVERAAPFEDAPADALTFAVEPRYLKRLHDTGAAAVIVPENFSPEDFSALTAALLKAENPKQAFLNIAALLHPPKEPDRIVSLQAVIGKGVRLGRDVTVGPNAYLGENVILGDGAVIMPNVCIQDNVEIGARTVIKPNVTIMENCRIGKDVILHSGTVIGSDGFGFDQERGKHSKIVHTGIVRIDDNVEIGACNTIDRGTFGRTWIKSGVKTDNLVHIAHNVTIGENSLLVAQAGIAGSTRIGDNVIVAGKAGISGHLEVGDNSIVGPLAGVVSNVPGGEIVSGMPQMPHKLWLKISRIMPRLPDMRKKILALENRVGRLEKRK